MAEQEVSCLPSTLVTAKRGSLASSERFSLLLLEFGEIYFEDFSAIYYPNAATEEESIERKQRGRLKVCSQSVLFDPLDFADPVIKIAYRDCQKIEVWKPLLTLSGSSRLSENSFMVVSSQVTEMLEGNSIAPYKFIKGQRRFLFSLNYGSIHTLLSQILTLHRATKLPKADQHSLIDSIVLGRRSEVSFNRSWLEDLYEETICEMTGERVTPLVSNPGRIMLTSSRLYFQPFNNVEPDPVLKLKLTDLKHVLKRRYMLRHVGIEFFCSGNSTLFLALSSPRVRNTLYDLVLSQPHVRLQEIRLQDATLQWQTGEMSNYQYLMLLNFLSDRSFNDIMQYPVMPWVVVDYSSETLDLTRPESFRDLSKPIGALNEERLAFFKERYSEMSGRKFLYGTHYSAPGYILYYLVRAAPECLLSLQNGRFDQPNRLFHCIAKTWENVNTDHADVKELIPEFYQPPGNFLLNLLNLDLGVRTDGMRVNDVVLPPWAKDAEDFTRQCRNALECDYISAHLHKWIDLIFGYRQCGEEAVKADNLFHYLTYEGAMNLDIIYDPEELAAVELQIKEFGQTPKQLFTTPHSRKITQASSPLTPAPPSTAGLGHADSDSFHPLDPHFSDPTEEWVHVELPRENRENVKLSGKGSGGACGIQSLKLEYLQKIHKEPVSSVKLSHDERMVFSVSHDKSLKVYSIEDRQLLRSAAVSNLPLSCLAVLPDSTTILVGSWDNHVYTYSVEYVAAVNSTYCHHSSVTSLCWKANTLATGSWDSTVKIWSLVFDSANNKPEPPELQCELDHDNEVSCVDIDSSVTKVASGTVDGYVTVWSISEEERIFELQVHNDGVHALLFSPDGSRLLTCGGDCIIRILDPATKCEVISKRAPEVFHCVAWSGGHIIFGSESGELHVWETETFKEVTRIKGHSGPVTCLDISESGRTVATGGRDKCIGIWSVGS